MKISINSTFSYIKFYLNYGSVLQCYALQRYLKGRGHSPRHVRDYRANPKYILLRLRNLKYPSLFWRKMKAQISVQRFLNDYLDFSERAYFTYRGLVKHCPDADCHIAGSDQIWHNANNFRYLTYVPKEKRKLSYAASFGRAGISDEMKRSISGYLAEFDGISVREKSGVGIINSMGYAAEHVVDPTLLLDAEQYPYAERQERGYCYCYFLNISNKSDVSYDLICRYCEEAEKELYVTAPLDYPLLLEETLLFPSVEEWLGLYKNADCIFTNTYHGMLFCIIFRKQFLVFAQKGTSEAENERFYSLLTLLNLTERMVSETDLEEMSALMEKTIDYDQVYSIIAEQRQKTDVFFARYGL